MDTFWRQGYEGTSTRDLCESTGLGPSSLYNTDEAKGRRGCFAMNAAMEAAALDPDVKRSVRRSFDRVEDELCAVVAAGQATGEITPGRDARALARLVQSTYYGLRVLSRVQDDRAVLAGTVEGTLAAL